jgi:hypothetical protein
VRRGASRTALTSVTAGTAILSRTAATPSNCSLTFIVYRNGARIGSGTKVPALKVTGLAAGTAYQFTVDPTDATGNSLQNSALAVTASSGCTVFNGVTLAGKLIWHSYSSYGFSGVHSWMASFDSGEVYDISQPPFQGAMNYAFSPDGTTVVVMAEDNTITAANGTTAWELWVASVTATGLANITRITASAADGSRNEDPRFSADGARIIFKRNLSSIMATDVATIAVNGLHQAPAQTLLLTLPTEASTPFYTVGSTTSFLYADEATKSIRIAAAGAVSTLYSVGAHAYYPIAIDPLHFYFAAGQSNYWIYRGDTSGGGGGVYHGREQHVRIRRFVFGHRQLARVRLDFTNRQWRL